MIKSLSQCLELVIDKRGVTPKKLNSDWKSAGFRVLSANNVKTSGIEKVDEIRFIDETTYRKWMKEEIRRGDILLTSEAPAGEVFYWDSDEKIVAGQRIYVLRTNCDVNPLFLKYYIQSSKGQAEIRNKCSGSTVFGISAKTFDNIEIVLPDDKETQDKIADTLRALDKKIENNNAINAELEAMAKTIYDYWFLQFEFPDENGKPYKSSGGKMVWNEELKQEIPYGWSVDCLKGKYNILRGLSYSSDDIKTGKGIPMINLASVDKNRNYKNDGLKYHNGNVPTECILNAGDLLIACTDLTRNADIVGCPILVPNDGNQYTFSMDMAKLTSASENIDELYLYMTLRTDFYHNFIKKWASGTNVLHLKLEGLDWYQTWFPPIELQKKYAKLICDTHKKKSQVLMENQELASLRDFLLPLLMNGQVTFKEN